MEIKSLGNVNKITTSYEKTLAADTTTKVQTAATSAGSTGETPVTTDKAIERKELDKEVEGLNKWLQSSNTHLKFQLHEKLNEYYVAIVDDQTNEVIREIPSKKVMDMVAKMHEMIGILIDEKR